MTTRSLIGYECTSLIRSLPPPLSLLSGIHSLSISHSRRLLRHISLSVSVSLLRHISLLNPKPLNPKDSQLAWRVLMVWCFPPCLQIRGTYVRDLREDARELRRKLTAPDTSDESLQTLMPNRLTSDASTCRASVSRQNVLVDAKLSKNPAQVQCIPDSLTQQARMQQRMLAGQLCLSELSKHMAPSKHMDQASAIIRKNRLNKTSSQQQRSQPSPSMPGQHGQTSQVDAEQVLSQNINACHEQVQAVQRLLTLHAEKAQWDSIVLQQTLLELTTKEQECLVLRHDLTAVARRHERQLNIVDRDRMQLRATLTELNKHMQTIPRFGALLSRLGVAAKVEAVHHKTWRKTCQNNTCQKTQHDGQSFDSPSTLDLTSGSGAYYGAFRQPLRKHNHHLVGAVAVRRMAWTASTDKDKDKGLLPSRVGGTSSQHVASAQPVYWLSPSSLAHPPSSSALKERGYRGYGSEHLHHRNAPWPEDECNQDQSMHIQSHHMEDVAEVRANSLSEQHRPQEQEGLADWAHQPARTFLESFSVADYDDKAEALDEAVKAHTQELHMVCTAHCFSSGSSCLVVEHHR